MAMAVGHDKKGPILDMNVTPLIDVFLVLIIIFMVITPMLQKGVSVDMARTENPRSMADADKEDAVLLAVTRDGKYFLGSDTIVLADVTTKVKDRLLNRLDKTVYVKSDARAKYGDVVALVDNVRAAGVDHIGLLAEKIERRMPGAAVAAGTP